VFGDVTNEVPSWMFVMWKNVFGKCPGNVCENSENPTKTKFSEFPGALFT
jgi:hypothetical protein